MKIKKGCSILGIRPEMMVALMVADNIWKERYKELVITSCSEGQHSSTSRHYLGCAVDVRTRYFDSRTVKLVAADLRERLEPEFKVIVHSTHIHIGFSGSVR